MVLERLKEGIVQLDRGLPKAGLISGFCIRDEGIFHELPFVDERSPIPPSEKGKIAHAETPTLVPDDLTALSAGRNSHAPQKGFHIGPKLDNLRIIGDCLTGEINQDQSGYAPVRDAYWPLVLPMTALDQQRNFAMNRPLVPKPSPLLIYEVGRSLRNRCEEHSNQTGHPA
jgi:hypothetical protein